MNDTQPECPIKSLISKPSDLLQSLTNESPAALRIF
jgi:hypothetical protein